MTNIWFISDTHFSHDNILTFRDEDDKLIRPEFKTINEMDETIIANWNSVVKPQDKIYHLGDVSFRNPQRMHEVLSRLNGHKRLIMGNHDTMDIKHYAKHFEKIGSWRTFKGIASKPFVACHYPLHQDCFNYRGLGHCVHGHIHQRLMKDLGYINVCVEHIRYKPIHMDEILARMT